MTDDLSPPDDDAPAADPFDAELVAYLDGELDPVEASGVEARLAADPHARARAAELKKSFDLLDFLPRPEPSATFASRTLDKLPALKVKSGPVPVGRPHPAPASPSGSEPVVLATGSVPVPVAPGPFGGRRWAAVVVAAAAAFATAGYFAGAVFRPHLFPAPPAPEVAAEPAPLHRVIEHLPLYATADDLAFVLELDRPDLFGSDPAVAFDPALKAAAPLPDRPSEHEALAQTYRVMPPARQAAVRELDRALYALDPRTRDRLFRVLEAYAVWLDRLPLADRRAVLGAATREDRLAAIRRVRDRQWADGLPAAHQAALAGMPDDKKRERVKELRYAEAARRDEWNAAANKAPWPFDTEAGRKDVLAFARAALHTDDRDRSPLSRKEFDSLTTVRDAAEKNGGPAWYAYGRELHVLLRRYERVVLSGLAPGEPAGPTRPDEFPDPLKGFIQKQLIPKLSPVERAQLGGAEGRWPDYARAVLQLARQHDLSAPGLMIPVSPGRWDATYGTRPRP